MDTCSKVDCGTIHNATDQFPWPLERLDAVSTEATDRNSQGAYSRDDVYSVDNRTGLTRSTRLLGADYRRYKLVGPDDFAYNPMRLNVGSIARAECGLRGIVSPDYVVFRCDTARLDPGYFDLFRRTAFWRDQIARSGQGSVRIRYYYRHIAEFLVPLPPVQEQRAIADVLMSVQRAKEATEKVIAATKELRKSLMRHLFTYGPVPLSAAPNVKLKQTEAGEIPAHWSVVRISEFARVGSGSTPARTNSAYWDGGTVPWITSGKVHDEVITCATMLVTERARRECHLPLVPRDSVVVAITGEGKTLGHAALLGLDTTINQHLAYIHCVDERILPEYLVAYLQTRYGDLRAVSVSLGSTKGALTCGLLKTYLVPIPSMGEQECIADAVRAARRSVRAAGARVAALSALQESLLDGLMSGRVRVPPFGGGAG